MGSIPKTGTRTQLDPEIKDFLSSQNPDLHLGSTDFTHERQHHTHVLGFHALPEEQRAPIGRVEFITLRGPYGTIPVRAFYPKSGEDKTNAGDAAALVYFHGGGYTVGTVDEFENGCRILAEEAGVQVYAVEYRLSPEWRYPTQLNEYDFVVEWLQGQGGKERGVHSDRVMGSGDSAGGNMTASICLRRLDQGKKPLHAQLLLYPEARLPFDTPAAEENNGGPYLECKSHTLDLATHFSPPLEELGAREQSDKYHAGNGIFSFADHYLPRGGSVSPSHRYISPGSQPSSALKRLPPAAVFTCGFDCLRDVGIEYASKLKDAGNQVIWHHFDTLCHGFLQMAPWSAQALAATKQVASEMKRLGCS
ncbi:hypothetical protein SMAC_07896 [Paecilomyces variotii No. 5]|uniref:Alpha/beta hydrolase fold-3 domain-containing protein n=1 Tax=Byssochlamys spectabilis (strain No. 5 / NBRC 109023) TaxID=1356009 RepID=V5FKU0_BYSSN|nr:hypothetical protein SMAC_07896 [Paecilomyces variotii No. 5]